MKSKNSKLQCSFESKFGGEKKVKTSQIEITIRQTQQHCTTKQRTHNSDK